MQNRYRLKKNNHYQTVYAKGKTFACKHMVLYYAENLKLKNEITKKDRYNNSSLKIGFSVSGKIGKANVRNKIRRRLKEATRLLIPHIKPNYKLIIMARTAIKQATFKEIKESIVYMLKKSNIWQS